VLDARGLDDLAPFGRFGDLEPAQLVGRGGEHLPAAVREELQYLAAMVREGLGISIVPTVTLFHFEHKDLRVRPVVSPGLKRQAFLVRRADRSLSSAAQGLYELLMAHRP